MIANAYIHLFGKFLLSAGIKCYWYQKEIFRFLAICEGHRTTMLTRLIPIKHKYALFMMA